jgi:hypothetical protein
MNYLCLINSVKPINMDALKLKQEKSPLTVQELPMRRERGLDVDDYNEEVWYTDDEVWERFDRRLIDHYGEEMRRLINEDRANAGERLL